MTEQTPKLDVQTIEYIRACVKKEREWYVKFAHFAEEDGYLDEAKSWKDQANTLSVVSNLLRRLIREQQEVA